MTDADSPDGRSPSVREAISRGFRISFEDAGVGDPLVLINGLTGSAAEWRELGFVTPLAKHHRVLSVDSLGHGRSDAPAESELYRYPDVAEDILAALDEASVERAALWGYSRGSRIACTVAIEHPERVRALILGGAELTGPPDTEIPDWIEPLRAGGWEAFFEAVPSWGLSEYDRQQFQLSDPNAIAAAVIGEARSAFTPDLSRVTAPTLVYCGGGDDPDAKRPTADALGTELHVVGDGDHMQAFGEAAALVPLVLAHLAAVR